MKQRLLLALLMLLTSAGFMKAQTTYPNHTLNVVIPATPDGEKTVTITFAGAFEDQSYPDLVQGTASSEAIGADKKSYTYTFKSKKDASISDLSFATAYAKAWGNVSITVDGPVSSFIVGNGSSNSPTVADIESQLPLLAHVTSIAFTNNGENLVSLKLGTNSTCFDYFPELISFSCPEHKLVYIPNKTTAPKMTSYNLGTVDLSNVELKNKGAANNFQFAVANLNFSGITSNLININDLTITNLRDKDGNALTEQVIVSQPKDVANGYWVFKNASGIYMDGTYTANIEVASTNKSYPGLVFGNVTLVVDPVEFTLKDVGTDKTKGSYDVYPKKSTDASKENKYYKGEELLITPRPNVGYAFTGFSVNGGLEKIASKDTDPEGSVRYKVVGNIDPEIKAEFAYGSAKVEFSTSSNANGNLVVYKGRIGEYTEADKISSGIELTVGSYVTIEVNANSGYGVKVSLNGVDITDQDKDQTDDRFKAEVQVPKEGANIVVEFTGEKRTLSIKLQGSGLQTLSVKNDNGEYQLSGVNTKTCKVAPNTRLAIGFSLMDATSYVVSSVLINGEEKWPAGVTRLEDGSYVVSDYWMPNRDVTVVITAKPLIEVTSDDITLLSTSFDYDGLSHEVMYKTKYADLSGIKVSYEKDGLSCNPIDAGRYTVKFEREADNTYKKIDLEKTFEINKVPLYITKLPIIIENQNGGLDIDGGEVRFMQNTGFSVETVDGMFADVQDPDKDGVVDLIFTPDDDSNFTSPSYSAQVAYGDKAKETVSVEILNEAGDAQLIVLNQNAVVSSGSTVVKGTQLSFMAMNKDVNLSSDKYHVYQVNDEGVVIGGDLLGTSFSDYADLKTLRFKLTVDDGRKHLTLDDFAIKEDVYDYSGKPIEYSIEKTFFSQLKIQETGANASLTWSNDASYWTITYYDLENNLVVSPVNVGTYKVKAVRKVQNAPSGYYTFETECKLIINQAEIPEASTLIPDPTASRITKGSPLYYSDLKGEAEIAGHYAFDVTDDKVILYESKDFPVKFVPRNNNYKEYKLKNHVIVNVTDKAVLQYGYEGYGTIEVVDEAGHSYWSGSEITKGTKLTVTATPDADYEFVSITKDGQSKSNPFTFEFEDVPVYIYATFKVAKEDPEIDPNSKYTVTLPTSLRGAVIDKPGANSVKRGESFSFSVATLAADASKVVVKVDGVTIKPVSGKYTITDITENKKVSVTLANPTPIKVTVPTEYKNEGGYLMGRVKISGPSDGKYYYNDQITLVAFPESNVHFDGWTGDLTGLTQIKEVVLTKDLTAGAKFSGTPTGIEDIMAASITTGKGCVWVRGIANADVTIVSIAGRVQAQERISGDTRIDVPAGIYVVVLESGSDVKRIKVIVK